MNKKTPHEWREEHPRCSFCKYCQCINSSFLGISSPDYYKCIVKDKIIKFPNLFRPSCACFNLKSVKAFEEKEIDNT